MLIQVNCLFGHFRGRLAPPISCSVVRHWSQLWTLGRQIRPTPFRSNGWPKMTDLLRERVIIEATPLPVEVRGNWSSGTSDEFPRCRIFHRRLQEKRQAGARAKVLRLQIEWHGQPRRSVCTQRADACTCDSRTVLRERRNQMLAWGLYLTLLLASLQAEVQISGLHLKRPRARFGDRSLAHRLALNLLFMPTVGGDLLNKVWRVLRRESCSGKLPHSAPISLSTI